MPPKSPVWDLFHSNQTKYKTNGTHLNAWCKACVAAEICQTDAMSECDPPLTDQEKFDKALCRVEPICGKRQRLEVHVEKCKVLTPQERASALLCIGKENVPPPPPSIPGPSHFPLSHCPPLTPTTSSTPLTGGRPLKRARTSLDELLVQLTQAEFDVDACKLFVACGIAWNTANNPEMQKFTNKWCHSNVKMSDWRVLSGRVLDGEVKKIEKTVKDAVAGLLVTGQCDGWKNVAKDHVVSTVMTAGNEPYLVRTHNMTGEPKTVIAWCTNDGPDGKKMRRLLQQQYPWIMVFVCWAHQINLVVGDFLNMKSDLLFIIAQCLEVIKWFNNHGTALALLKNEMKFTYEGKIWSLVLPVITRWTAHYLSSTRLLKVKGAVTSCVHRHEEKLKVAGGKTQEVQKKAEEIIQIVKDSSFWNGLAKIQAILELLAIAANITQASHTRLDHVLLTLGNLFRIYSSSSTQTLDAEIAYGIQSSLEKQWEKADQDIFILAVFFNPYIRSCIFNPAALTESSLYGIVDKVFKRFYGCVGDLALYKAFTGYVRGEGDFSPEEMNLERIKEMFNAEDKPLDVVFVWKTIDSQPSNAPPEGSNALVKLAMLKSEKVQKTGVVKMDIKQSQLAEGHGMNRSKRKFGQMESPSDENSPNTPLDPSDFHALADLLINEANDDDIEPNPSQIHVAAQPSNPGSTSRRGRGKITLDDSFLMI
ncbi:ribonuclease H-like domain-containing protein [Crassisporium funariophilum]|nr:ribonuclease H-like domain-containing protein [Crassisporium funariophilum]